MPTGPNVLQVGVEPTRLSASRFERDVATVTPLELGGSTGESPTTFSPSRLVGPLFTHSEDPHPPLGLQVLTRGFEPPTHRLSTDGLCQLGYVSKSVSERIELSTCLARLDSIQLHQGNRTPAILHSHLRIEEESNPSRFHDRSAFKAVPVTVRDHYPWQTDAHTSPRRVGDSRVVHTSARSYTAVRFAACAESGGVEPQRLPAHSLSKRGPSPSGITIQSGVWEIRTPPGCPSPLLSRQ